MGSETLTEFELLVLLAALSLGPEAAYTVSIAEHIRERTGRTLRRANIFTSLRRLEERGLISTHIGESRPERGGRPPRLVKVEPAGVAAVRSTSRAIQTLVADAADALGRAR